MIRVRLFERQEASFRRHMIHLGIYAAIAALVVLLDQITKAIVVRTMEIGESIPWWEGVFHITRVRPNPGAAFSMFSSPDQRWIFLTFSTVAIVGICFYLWADRTVPVLGGVSLAMILGGGIGNMIDRLSEAKAVVDFFDFCLINFAVFNVADVFVCVGAGLMLLTLILTWVEEFKKKGKKE